MPLHTPFGPSAEACLRDISAGHTINETMNVYVSPGPAGMVSNPMVFAGMMQPRIFVHVSRILLRGIAHVLGSLGSFCFFGSCMNAPLAAEAILCLGTATAIILACAGED